MTNHRDSEKLNYHSCMKINCHVDPVVPPRQLALVNIYLLFIKPSSLDPESSNYTNIWCKEGEVCGLGISGSGISAVDILPASMTYSIFIQSVT